MSDGASKVVRSLWRRRREGCHAMWRKCGVADAAATCWELAVCQRVTRVTHHARTCLRRALLYRHLADCRTCLAWTVLFLTVFHDNVTYIYRMSPYNKNEGAFHSDLITHRHHHHHYRVACETRSVASVPGPRTMARLRALTGEVPESLRTRINRSTQRLWGSRVGASS